MGHSYKSDVFDASSGSSPAQAFSPTCSRTSLPSPSHEADDMSLVRRSQILPARRAEREQDNRQLMVSLQLSFLLSVEWGVNWLSPGFWGVYTTYYLPILTPTSPYHVSTAYGAGAVLKHSADRPSQVTRTLAA